MRESLVVPASVLALALAAPNAFATDYWVGPPGTGSDRNAGTQAAPFATFGMGARTAQAGDTVHVHGGVYSESIVPAHTGTASAWITFEAAPGELPILDGTGMGGTGFSAGGTGFIRVIGVASRRWGSSGFDNGFTNSVGNVQYIDCIADNNGINGIAFYKATGVLIENSIVLHNGNQMPSWSSGVNLFTAGGTFQDNQVIGNVSFENVDISTTHSTPTGHPTDGSGFILDQQSTGALFENNIGFRNGGSCIRLTNSSGAHMINNTCFSDAMDPNDGTPSNPAEIFFSDNTTTTTNVIAANDLAVPNTNNIGINQTKGTGSTFIKNLTTGAGTLFTNATAADFVPAASATTVIDQGDATNAPSTDVGFDPRCITQTSVPVVGTAITWWAYFVDYTYISTVGIAACFHPAVRPQGGAPDIGAYETGGVLSDAGAGPTGPSSSSSGGTAGSSSSSSGGATGGASSSSGATGGGKDAGAGGTGSGSSSSGSSGGGGSGSSSGGSSSGGAGASSSGGSSHGGSGGSGGTGEDASPPPAGGAGGVSGGDNATGCDVTPGTGRLPLWASAGVALIAAAGARRRRRAR